LNSAKAWPENATEIINAARKLFMVLGPPVENLLQIVDASLQYDSWVSTRLLVPMCSLQRTKLCTYLFAVQLASTPFSIDSGTPR
jgi:hypothetical protein